jgi:hypothetical protein
LYRGIEIQSDAGHNFTVSHRDLATGSIHGIWAVLKTRYRNRYYTFIRFVFAIGHLQSPAMTEINVDGLDIGVAGKSKYQNVIEEKMRLCRDVLRESILSQFTTDTRLLVPSEGHLCVQLVDTVDPGGTGLELVCGLNGAVQVLREHRCGKAVN